MSAGQTILLAQGVANGSNGSGGGGGTPPEDGDLSPLIAFLLVFGLGVIIGALFASMVLTTPPKAKSNTHHTDPTCISQATRSTQHSN